MGAGKDFPTSRNMLSPLHCFQIVTMLVSRGGARFHQFPPQERDVAPRGTFKQARIVFGGDASPLVPSMNNDDIKTKVFRERLPGRPLVEDCQNGVCLLHTLTK